MKVKVWALYVVPVFLLGLAIYEYIDLSAWEAEGGVRYMGRSERTLYRLGGKWGVVGATAGAAAIWLAGLVTYLRHSRRQQRQATEHEASRARDVGTRLSPASASAPVAAPTRPATAAPMPKRQSPSSAAPMAAAKPAIPRLEGAEAAPAPIRTDHQLADEPTLLK